jgi:hypothetical protein
MALSSAKGFVFKKSISPSNSNPATLEVVIANSAANLTVGDPVQFTSGYLTIAATGESILGILVGLVDKNGRNIFQTGVSVTGTKVGDDSYTAASDNQTVDMVKGVVYIDPNNLYLNKADSSLTQAEVGQYFDTNAATDQVTGSGSDTISQFQLIELVTTNDAGEAVTDLGLFKISQSQLGWVAS